ncbi:AraC family transcriptional regulator [Microbaculum marinum]|uniref:AraC family transcriptional regulator n=1 Tax=Microbaculum marinum TaxID=1764581 RepID=A0AAW9S0L3_9HYPH
MANQDQLSDVFATLRLRSDVYFRADLSGGFSILVPAERRLIRFHFVLNGVGGVRLGGDWVEMEEGDLVIVPNGAGHVIADCPDRAPVPLPDVLGGGAMGEDGVLTYGSGEGRLQLLCGYCGVDEAVDHPVVAGLPPSIVLRTRDLGHEPWILASLRLLALESGLAAQGMNGTLSRLLEILLIQTLRRVPPPGEGAGYMAALADPKLSRALSAMHADPARPWTILDLARVAGMSRAGFSDRFTRTVGLPPLGYLTTWRLLKARRLLRETDLAIDEIALRCGYASLPSFTRRYKAAYGIGPGAYRRAERPR